MEIDPLHEKALHRGARACQALGNLTKAAILCERGLKAHPKHSAFLALKAELIAQVEQQDSSPPAAGTG